MESDQSVGPEAAAAFGAINSDVLQLRSQCQADGMKLDLRVNIFFSFWEFPTSRVLSVGIFFKKNPKGLSFC